MDENELVRGCLANDDRAWKSFYSQFKNIIARRTQMLLRLQYPGAPTIAFEDAFDFVIDKFISGSALRSFRGEGSLTAYINTVTTNAFRDWSRRRSSGKQMFGVDPQVLVAANQDSDKYKIVGIQTESDDQIDIFTKLDETESSFVRLLLIRYTVWKPSDIRLLRNLTGRSVSELVSAIRSLRILVTSRCGSADEKFLKCNILHTQIIALSHRTGPKAEMALERKTAQHAALLDEYRKRGFDEFPKRQELADILGWDINKVDRLKRQVTNKLKGSDGIRVSMR